MRVATRRSVLARTQASQVGRLLRTRVGADVELVPMATTGDRSPEQAVDRFDTKGIFVDTIRQAVLEGDCDLAVHSLKDLPAEEVPGLVVAAVPPRADPRDALVTREGRALAELADGALVGTSSERRRVQVLHARPDLRVEAVRGNLDTRLRKVADGRLDALVLALAGLERLADAAGEESSGAQDSSRGAEAAAAGEGRAAHQALDLPAPTPLAPEECLPAAGQGALAVECRADDADTLAALAALDDPDARRGVVAERAFLASLGGGCLAPVGALCRVSGSEGLAPTGTDGLAQTDPDGVVPTGPDGLALTGLVADPTDGRVVRLTRTGPADEPHRLGTELAEQLRVEGGADLLASIAQVRGRRESGEAAH